MKPDDASSRPPSRGFWAEAWERYRGRPIGMIALAFVVFLTVVASFAPAIAGTKPVICRYKGRLYMPCLGYFNRRWEAPVFTKDKFRGTYPQNLKDKDPDSWAIWPLVFQDPYRRVRDNEWPGRPENPSRDEGRPNAINLFGTDQYGVEQVFDRLFTADGTAQIDFDIEAVRPIREDVAVADGVSRLALAGRQPTRSRFSAVLVRHEGRWLIESVREATAPASPSVRDRLAPLAWLRGSWEDVSDGLTISMQCDWAAEGGFLIRRHLITDEPQPPGGVARSTAGIPALLPTPTPDGAAPVVVQRRTITEFIGWDQGRGEIRSWMFCSDGRTAEFRWLRSGTGWLLTHANDPAAATAEPAQLMLERVGADELTLQLQSGIVDDLLPAADFVRTARPIDGDAND